MFPKDFLSFKKFSRFRESRNLRVPIYDREANSIGWLARWRGWSACDVGEATSEGLENEQSFIQLFRRFTYGTAHSPILPVSLHLRHRHFTYVTYRASHGDLHIPYLWARESLVYFTMVYLKNGDCWVRPYFSERLMYFRVEGK